MLVGPGENAGVIDAGDGIAVAIRIESHNHPSAIEPYQGAATGVGGILRDIFTMGARPIAVMDPLFFGDPGEARQRWLIEGVVAGISGYGNSVGVPTVGGELTFDPCYAQNPLVNVLCMGVLPTERLVLGQASGIGNLAVLLGSSTGRDGIGGVSVLASAGFGGEDDDADAAKRPSVQVGDPYEEKRLIEACLELLDAKLVVGIQDLGGCRPGLRHQRDGRPGRGGHGRRRLGGAPPGAGHGGLRGDDLGEPGADAGHRHPRRPGPGGGGVPPLGGAGRGGGPGDRAARRRRPAGSASSTGSTGRCWATCRPSPSATTPRSTTGPWRGPADQDARPADDPGALAAPADCGADVLALLTDPSWVYRQYDHQLFLNTVEGPGGDAAVLRLAAPGLPPSERGLALSTDSNPGVVLASTPGPGRRPPWPRRPSTWPAPGPGRWPWSTASTSATPSTPR